MYQLKTEADFDSAHFLSGYTGKCSNIHGHRWHVEIGTFAGVTGQKMCRIKICFCF